MEQAVIDETKEEEIETKEILASDIMREEYNELPYHLPTFDAMCEDFDIEKAFDKDSSFLLREIRKLIMEKLSAYLQLFEMFMNPSSPPLFILKALRNLENTQKDVIKDMYEQLAKFQLTSVRLDTVYDEKREAEFVMHAFDTWQNLKDKIYNFIEKLEKASEKENIHFKSDYVN